MPEPHRAHAGHPAGERMSEDARPPGQRKRARQTNEQERRHNEQKQNVLQHVCAKKITIGEGIDRREQREKKNDQRQEEPSDARSHPKGDEVTNQRGGRSDESQRVPRPGRE